MGLAIRKRYRTSCVETSLKIGLSMGKYIDNWLIACKLSARATAWFLSIVFVATLSSSAIAAGCNYHQEQPIGRKTGLAHEGVIKVYENGRFYYHNAIPPCSGPSCKRSSPTSVNAQPIAIVQEQQSSPTILASHYAFSVTEPSSLCLEFQSQYASPSFDELLRPPV